MISQYESLSRLLKAKRQERKVSHKALGRAVKASARSVYGWESGDRAPDAPQAYALAVYYDLPVDKFLAACAGSRAHFHMIKIVDSYIAVAQEHGVNICSRQGC